MELIFVLVEPAVPENIGAAARAINTMGFTGLRLVNPCNHLNTESRKLAHGSLSILKNARLFHSFEDSVVDMDLVIGTTSKSRRTNYDKYTPQELSEILTSKEKTVHNVAIVFGSEEHGLTNDQLRKCHFISTIPLAKPFPSLNLAQAVSIYAFCLSPLSKIKMKRPEKDPLHFPVVMKKINTLFNAAGIYAGTNLHNRLSERLAVVNDDDLNLLSSVSTKMIEKFLTLNKNGEQ